jgi:hypothetical protein
MSALPPIATAKADIGAFKLMSAKGKKRTFTELIRQDPSAARLLKELAIVGHGVEEFDFYDTISLNARP